MKAKILELLRRNGDYVSGQELCKILNVSRTAVWKSIRSLEGEGYHIEAVRNKGYRLIEDPAPGAEGKTADIYSAHEIKSRLEETSGVRDVLFFETIDSTNSECARRAEAGEDGGLLIVSEDQSLGRGRRGRTWESPGGVNVYFSLMIRPKVDPKCAPMMTLLMALAVCMGMEKIHDGSARKAPNRKRTAGRTPDSPLIKWPNDIVISGRKCCGMLTEMSCEEDYIRHVVIGVGINVRHQDFAPDIRDTAISLDDAWNMKVKRSILIAEIMNEFGPLLEEFEKRSDLGFVRGLYLDRLVNAGKKVRVLSPSGDYEALARGINENGELLVETPDGVIHEINSGEVSVRGVYGYV
ncbi:MAG: biotin--[acetyl-CoA-carboxylase] ligase [Lachnospiraceae bacterium]|nr:biotin--[acetyl-CoA-carboxylase] ligase [Lachnospiraceae bacterium]